MGVSEELFYDKAGNRTKRLYNGAEELYQYDKRNRLTAHTKGGVTTQYEYDNAGNLLKDGRARYEYDAFSRNTKAETFDGNIQINRYDAEGLRHEMEENGKLVTFIFRGNEAVTEETDSNIIRHIRGYDLIASDAENARTYYHYASDEMSSITHVAEGTQVLNHYEYDAWGNLTACEEKVQNRFRFNGQQYDSVTQQYYLRARYYNPVIGRFTQEDTYNSDGLNLYAYCRNNPVYYVDPSGNICETAANRITDKVNSNSATRNEQKKLAAYLRDKDRKGGLTDAERSTLNKIDGYTYLNRYENQTPRGQSNHDSSFNRLNTNVGEVQLPRNTWRDGPTNRGKTIDDIYNANNPKGTGSNYPVIDMFDHNTGEATSVKSRDLNSKSYQDGGTLERTIKRDVDKLAAFDECDWGDTFVDAGETKDRTLLMVVPNVALSESQIQAINNSIQYAEGKDVKIEVTVGVEK